MCISFFGKTEIACFDVGVIFAALRGKTEPEGRFIKEIISHSLTLRIMMSKNGSN